MAYFVHILKKMLQNRRIISYKGLKLNLIGERIESVFVFFYIFIEKTFRKSFDNESFVFYRVLFEDKSTS